MNCTYVYKRVCVLVCLRAECVCLHMYVCVQVRRRVHIEDACNAPASMGFADADAMVRNSTRLFNFP